MRFNFIFLCFFTFAVQAQKANNKVNRPKLVVGLVIDQMRYDFLYRYSNRYSKDGFNRLLSKGNSCENTFISYLPSYTAPGHTCIYTGSVPALHGIASNDWLDRLSGKSIYCTDDSSVSNVGGNLKNGKMSPKNLWASTITDELRLATNMDSKVIAISLKDRAAILPGGHLSNGTYWMDDSLGLFMSSSFYMKSLPLWVSNFNDKKRAKELMKDNWNTLYPIESYTQSTNDQNAYEGKFAGETTTTFPHEINSLKQSDIKKTPFGNSLLFEFAKEAIKEEKLGQGTETDFLAISCSSTDYVGHQFGPNSIEVEDIYLRLDLELGDFLSYLDDEVGKGNYTLFLTADHGVAHNPQFLLDNKQSAGFFYGKNFLKELNTNLNTTFNSNRLVKQVGENFVWLNHVACDSAHIDEVLVKKEILKLIQSHEEIQFAVDMQQLEQTSLPQPIKDMAINGYVAKRSGDILLLLNPAWLDAYAVTGTTHGTWNPYDTHIPLLWYGWGIKQGTSTQTVYMTDIAATLATLLHIQMPNACVGKAIESVLEKN